VSAGCRLFNLHENNQQLEHLSPRYCARRVDCVVATLQEILGNKRRLNSQTFEDPEFII